MYSSISLSCLLTSQLPVPDLTNYSDNPLPPSSELTGWIVSRRNAIYYEEGAVLKLYTEDPIHYRDYLTYPEPFSINEEKSLRIINLQHPDISPILLSPYDQDSNDQLIQNRRTLQMSFIEGEQLHQLLSTSNEFENDTVAFNIGSALKKLHEIKPLTFDKNLYLSELYNFSLACIYRSQNLLESQNITPEYIKNFIDNLFVQLEDQSFSLIHNDLWGGNILIDTKTNSKAVFVDFERSAPGLSLLDVGHFYRYYSIDQKQDISPFLEGYSISQKELELLKPICILRLLSMLDDSLLIDTYPNLNYKNWYNKHIPVRANELKLLLNSLRFEDSPLLSSNFRFNSQYLYTPEIDKDSLKSTIFDLYSQNKSRTEVTEYLEYFFSIR